MNNFFFPRKRKMEYVIDDECKKWMKKEHNCYVLSRNHDLPVIIYLMGQIQWIKNGEFHRNKDLPAMIFSNGTRFWYKKRVPYREKNLPHVIYSDGKRFCYR